MKRLSLKSRNENGYVMAALSAGLAVFLSFFALVADLGYIYVTKAQLQNTADSAALAAVVSIPEGIDEALERAIDFGSAHVVAGQAILIGENDVAFGRYNFQTNQFNPGSAPVNGLSVTASRAQGSASGALPLIFAPLFGKENCNVAANTVAALDPHVVGVRGKNRLIPYSVIDFVVDGNADGLFDVGSVINIYPRSDAPGNFGFLDLDGGSNDIPELRQYIEEGYDKDFLIPPGGSIEVGGSTGINGNSVINSFQTILNEIVFLPVHDYVTDPGDNARFNVIAILAVRIEDVRLVGNPDVRHIRVEIVSFASSVLATDPNAPENNSVFKPRLVS